EVTRELDVPLALARALARRLARLRAFHARSAAACGAIRAVPLGAAVCRGDAGRRAVQRVAFREEARLGLGQLLRALRTRRVSGAYLFDSEVLRFGGHADSPFQRSCRRRRERRYKTTRGRKERKNYRGVSVGFAAGGATNTFGALFRDCKKSRTAFNDSG